jgi:EAL domain-containing protein (putative c-di-GMP-specific phosphodiesterase class I)
MEASVGIALYPEHAADAGTLLQKADVAMRHAKQQRTGFSIYLEENDPFSRQRLVLFGELRQAVKEGALELHYQPKIDMRSGRVTEAEALARWFHPEYGRISPAEFIPLAERTGLIDPITHWAIEEALTQSHLWQDSGTGMKVAVNLSAKTLLSGDFPQRLRALQERSGSFVECIALEITESAIMQDPERAIQILSRICDMGVSLSIDDFGTGYSSLSYLKRISADELKIDQSFVMGMRQNAKDRVIVRSTINLAHDLGMKVVAEGVEDKETWNMLREFGCDVAQGYLMSAAMPAEQFSTWRSSYDPSSIVTS